MDAILGAMTGAAQTESFDVHEEVCRAVEQLESGGAAVNVSVPRGTRAAGSGVAFRLALHNLVRNALESSPGVQVNVRVDSGAGRDALAVTVSDNGCGLPPSVTVDPYRAFQSSSKGGSGLGLSIAAMLLRSGGGDIILAHTGPTGTSWLLVLQHAAASNTTKAA